MFELSEDGWYSLHSSIHATGDEAVRRALDHFEKMMIFHLWFEHGKGVRQIAKELGIKWTNVKFYVDQWEKGKGKKK